MALNLAAIIASSEQGVVLPWLIARSRFEAAAVLWCAGFSDKPKRKNLPVFRREVSLFAEHVSQLQNSAS